MREKQIPGATLVADVFIVGSEATVWILLHLMSLWVGFCVPRQGLKQS